MTARSDQLDLISLDVALVRSCRPLGPVRERRKRRDEQGQVTRLIIGFASILLMAVVVVIDLSAAYLQRQGLDNLADGAALHGADLGSIGVYEHGLGDDRLAQQEAAVDAAVRDYLARAGAGATYPDIDVAVRVDPVNRSVTVRLRAPLDLPLTIPGSPSRPLIGATITAPVTVLD